MSSLEPEPRTPILNLISPLPQRWQLNRLTWRQVVVVVFVPILVIFVSVFLALEANITAVVRPLELLDSGIQALVDSFGPLGPLLVIIAFFGIILVTVTIHESAHLMAGSAVGFRFQMLQVGPFSLVRLNGRTKVQVRRLSTFDGNAAVQIPSVRRLRRKLALFIAAGPLASLVSGLFVALLLLDWFSLGLRPASLRSAQFFVAFSLFMFTLNALPFRRSNGQFTDGARLLMLARSRLKTRRWLSLIALAVQNSSGVRPKHWNRNWIRAASCISDRSLDALSGAWFAYAAANDRKESEEAAYYLEQCLQRSRIVAGPSRTILILEAAVFHAWFRSDAKKARTWFARVQDTRDIPPLVLVRAEVALHFAERRMEEAASSWEKGLTIIKSFPASPSRETSEQSWLEWQQEMNRRLSTTQDQAHT